MLTRRKLLAGTAAAVLAPKQAEAWRFGTPVGVPTTSYLIKLAGVTAGSLNMLPWTANATHSDFAFAETTPNIENGFTKTRSSISATNILAPDGTSSGQHLSEDSSTNTHWVGTLSTPYSISFSFIPIRVSVIAKAAERTRMVVQWQEGNNDPTGSNVEIGFDLAGGNTGYDNTVGANQTLLAGPTMTSLGSGWWLCQFDVVYNTFVESTGATLWTPKIYIDSGSGTAARSISYAGNGTSGIDLWWFNAMPVQAWSITNQQFLDDFTSLGTIDLANTQAPGFNWYIRNDFPNAVPQSFWNITPQLTPSPPGNFTLISPSVLQILNPNTNANGFSTLLTSVCTNGANGYIGQVFQGPCMYDCSISTTNVSPSPNWVGTPTLWSPSVNSKTNNGLNPTFQFREFNTFETGNHNFSVGEGQDWLNPTNHEAPTSYGVAIGQPGVAAVLGVFHRISAILITQVANGFGWGCVMGFADGQMQSLCSYNPTATPNPLRQGAGPISPYSQEDWHIFCTQLATGENTTSNAGGGWPLWVDWVRIFNNPSAPKPRPTWNNFDQPGTGVGTTGFVGNLVLTQNNNASDGLTATKTVGDAAWDMIRSGMGKGAGKWYWEITITGTVATSTSLMLGIVDATQTTLSSGGFPGSTANGAGARNGSNWNAFATGVTTPFSGTVGFLANDVFGFAFDADGGNMYIHRNGTWINGPPSGGSGGAVWTGLTTASPGISAAGWYPAVALHDTTCTAVANFGQSAFAFAVPSGYNSGLF